VGRLRARLARAEEDRELSRHLAEAERALGRAMGACSKVVRNGGGRYGTRSAIRARENLRTIRKSLSLIQNIGQMVPAIDTGDQDLLPEQELAAMARQRREARDERRRAQREAAAQQMQGS
jgi:hypothetical protein